MDGSAGDGGGQSAPRSGRPSAASGVTPSGVAGAQDPALQRARMVEDLRRRGVEDERVLAAMAVVPRELFVPAELRERAYDDAPLPLGEGQTISQPLMVAMMAELLALAPTDRVLDVGTGSGYAAAVLAHLAGEVWTIERRPALAARARGVLAEEAPTVRVVEGDGSLGWPAAAPFDAIGVAAAAPVVPKPLLAQLAQGGRLVLPVGEEHEPQQLHVLVREGDRVTTTEVCAVRFVPLVSDPGNPGE